MQRWAEAASFVHGVDSRDSTFQPILVADGFIAALMVSAIRRRGEDCPDAAIPAARPFPFLGPSISVRAARLSLITTPGSRAAHAQAVGPAILTPAVHGPRPAVPERPLPAAPAVGPPSSGSTVPTLRRLRRCLPCSHSACLPVVPDKPRLCPPVVGPLSLTLLRINCHCHFSSLQLNGGSTAITGRQWPEVYDLCHTFCTLRE